MENKNVFEETVKTLTNDAMSLQQKFHKLQESGDIRASIDCLRLLKDTLSLIKEYDWHLEYSEYETDGHKEVSVWEQNHAGEIRNHKRWNVPNKKNDMKNKWEDLLRVFIENKQSMLYELSYDKDAQKEHRGTGKSTAIEKLAIEYDLPIFTSKFKSQNYNKNMSLRQFRDKSSRAYATYNDFRATCYDSKIVLVDEGFVDSNLFDDLMENHKYILIGFKVTK